MDITAIILILLVLILVVLFISRPFSEKHDGADRPISGHDVSHLLAERDRILNEIQDLDFDNTLGKIPAEDYPIQRRALLQQGANVLRQIDALSFIAPVDETRLVEASSVMVGLRGVENQVFGHQRAVEAGPAFTDEDLEEMIAKRRTSRSTRTAGFCPRCGKPLLQTDVFCACCGQPVQAGQ